MSDHHDQSASPSTASNPVTPLRPWAVPPGRRTPDAGYAPGASWNDELTADDLLDALAEMLAERPFHFLEFVARTVLRCPHDLPELAASVRLHEPAEIRAVVIAGRWLQHHTATTGPLAAGAPPWLVHLGDAEVTAVRRRRDRELHETSHLIGLELVDGPAGAIELRVDDDSGAIAGALVWDAHIEELQTLVRTVVRSERRYRDISPATAELALVAAFGRHQVGPRSESPFESWPENAPLVAFVLRRLIEAPPFDDRRAAS